MRKWIYIALFLTPFAAQASDEYGCWRGSAGAAGATLTAQELVERISADGWKVQRIERDDGCWEIHGFAPDGARIEAYFHPVTGELVKLERE